MLSRKELLNAIEECETEPINSNKISKLADFYIIYNQLFGEPISLYPLPELIENKNLQTNSDTEFLAIVNGKNADSVILILSELVETTKTLHPRMYDSLIEKLSEI